MKRNENAIDAIKAAISKLEDSIYIDALRMNKGWHPFQVPEIVNLKKALKILEDNESQFTFCCKDIKNPDCNCMKYIKESGILTHG